MSFDHGEINIPMAGKRGRALDAEIQREVAKQRREDAAKWKADRKAEREAEAARIRLTRDDVMDARLVRLKHLGWREVLRVSAKTVTVKGDPGFDDHRIPFDQVLEVRR